MELMVVMTTVTENSVKKTMNAEIKGLYKQDWLNVIGAINVLVEEATVNLDTDKLHFRGMDPSHIALVDLQLPDRCFERYEVSEPCKFGIRIDEVLKIVKVMANRTKKNFGGDQLQIKLTEGDLITFRLTETGINYDMRLIEVVEGSCPTPKISFNAKFELDKERFYKALKNISVYSDYVTFEASANMPEQLVCSSIGDSGTVKQILEPGEGSVLTYDVGDNSKATFSLEYLLSFLSAIKVQNLTLEYSSKMPIKLSMKIAEYGQIDFYIAPRVEG